MTSYTTKQPETVHYTTCPDSPAGKLLIGTNEEGKLCRSSFLSKQTISDLLMQWQDEWPKTDFIKSAKPISYRTLIKKELLLVGTAFQQKVWQGILTIPAGKTLSYGELSARIKKPKAARAVGSACGKNPIPLIVPCHRIIAGNGSIGGFSSDSAIKVKLLKAEKSLPKN